MSLLAGLSQHGDSIAAHNGDAAAHGCEKIAKLRSLINRGRVDFAFVGDSNVLFGGHGWDHGVWSALSARLPIYAGPLLGGLEGGGANSGHGWDAFTNASQALTYGTVPVAFSSYVNSDLGNHHGMYYTENAIRGTYLLMDDKAFRCATPGIPQAWVKYHIQYGQFSGAGSFRPAARLNVPPYTELFRDSAVSASGETALVWASREYRGLTDTVGKSYAFGPGGIPNTDVQPPFLHTLHRIEFPAVARGFSHTVYVARGGQSARVVAAALQANTQAAKANIIGSMVRLQGADKSLIVLINEGLNDRNDSASSVGPSPAASNTAAGFADNMAAIIADIRSTWASLGYAAGNLFFVLCPSHPVESGDTSLLFARTAANTVADSDSNVIFCDLSTMTDYAEMTALGFYDGAGVSHLKQAGYIYLSELVFDYIIGPRIADLRAYSAGDASVVLSPRAHPQIINFSTTLTANRTITLSTKGSRQGDQFRVVRTGLGSYTLDVGGLKTIPSATAAWCDVVFDGAAWMLSGYGPL